MDFFPDESVNEQAGFIYWEKLAAAIEEVEHLANDEIYAKAIYERAIRTSADFSQGFDTICVENTPLFGGSVLTKHRASDRYITLKDMYLIATQENDENHLAATFTINEQQLTVFSDNGSLFLSENSGLPETPIEPEDVSRFLLAMGAGFSGEQPTSAEALLSQYERYDGNPWLQLQAVISLMGNFFGESTQNTRAFFPSSHSGIIAELVATETPSTSSMQNQLLLHQADGAFPENIGHFQEEETPADPWYSPRRIASHAISSQMIDRLPVLAQSNNPFAPNRGTVYTSREQGTPTKEMRRYGLLCAQFLEGYKELIAAQL